MFGWLHLPAADRMARVGVVICAPLGYESVCAYRSLRHFATAAADAGFPTLRFDYDGVDNSAGNDLDSARFDAWLASIHQASDYLKASSGVDEIVLFGIRLGATLAALVGDSRPDVSGVAMLAPIISGKTYLRELRARIAGESIADDDSDIMEVAGFQLTAETRDALAAIDLSSRTLPAGKDVLVIDRTDLPAARRYADALQASGGRVEYRRIDGYSDMLANPHVAVVPTKMIAAFTDWLRSHATSPHRDLARSTYTPINTARFRIVHEHATFLDERQPLFAIITRPTEAPPTPLPAIVLINDGAVHEVGPSRLYVLAARRWAANGHTVVRMTISGIGSSPSRHGETENVVYSRHAIADIALALAALRAKHGLTRILIGGVCSGGYHALKAALADIEVEGILVINPLTFSWKPGMSLEGSFVSHVVTAEARNYFRSATQLKTWNKILRGQFDPWHAVGVFVRHTRDLVVSTSRNVARQLGIELQDDLATDLRTLARAGKRMLFIFSDSDPGLEILRREAGSTLHALQRRGQIAIRVIPQADHIFTHASARQSLLRTLARELGQRGKASILETPDSTVLTRAAISADS